jgi:hypothetical protein
MEQITYEATSGFNTIFNIIENCKIAIPEYDVGFSSGRFFFEKRNGLTEVQDLNEATVGLGRFESSTVDEDLVLTTSYLKKFTASSTTNIDSVTSDTKIFNDVTMNFPGGGIADSGTATGGSATVGGVYAYLADTSKSWTPGEFAGKYIWIESGTGGGDVVSIIDNDATTISVQNWTSGVPSAGSTYTIHNELVTTPILSSATDGKSYYYDGEDLLEIPSIGAVKLYSEFAGRLWYVPENDPDILYYSQKGQPFIEEGYVNFRDTIVDICPFGDYIIVGMEKKISAMRKELDAEGIEVFNSLTLLPGKGVFSKDAIANWNGGLFFVDDQQKIFSMSINVVSDKPVPDINEISEPIGGYIENYNAESAFFLAKPQELNVILRNNTDSNTRIFKFSSKYKGWLVDVYPVYVQDYQLLGNDYYLCVGDRVCSPFGTTDLGTAFNQRVGFLFGLDTIMALKRIYTAKIVFQYEDNNYCKMSLQTNGAYLREDSSKNVDIDQLLKDGTTSTYGGFGTNAFGVDVFGDGYGDIYSSLRIYKVFVNRVGNYFQGILEDESTTGFSVGAVSLFFTPSNPYIGPRRMSS